MKPGLEPGGFVLEPTCLRHCPCLPGALLSLGGQPLGWARGKWRNKAKFTQPTPCPLFMVSVCPDTASLLEVLTAGLHHSLIPSQLRRLEGSWGRGVGVGCVKEGKRNAGACAWTLGTQVLLSQLLDLTICCPENAQLLLHHTPLPLFGITSLPLDKSVMSLCPEQLKAWSVLK